MATDLRGGTREAPRGRSHVEWRAAPRRLTIWEAGFEPAGVPTWARRPGGSRSVTLVRSGMYALVTTPSPEAAAAEAAGMVARAIAAAVADRDVAHVSLAGGTTPRRAYELLGPMVTDWGRVHLWFGDERCVPPDDPDSNFRLVSESLLPTAAVPEENIHRIAGEWPPEEGAETYAAELARHVALTRHGVPALDLAILGLGEDGHTASLFPGDPMIGISRGLVRHVLAPKPPPHRITLTLDVLHAARAAILLATGEGKARAVEAVLRGPDVAVPASLLPPATTTMIVDEAAGARLRN